MLDFGIGHFCTLIISAEVQKCIIIPVPIPLFELSLNGQALFCPHTQLLFCEIPQLNFLRLKGVKVEKSRISSSDGEDVFHANVWFFVEGIVARIHLDVGGLAGERLLLLLLHQAVPCFVSSSLECALPAILWASFRQFWRWVLDLVGGGGKGYDGKAFLQALPHNLLCLLADNAGMRWRGGHAVRWRRGLCLRPRKQAGEGVPQLLGQNLQAGRGRACPATQTPHAGEGGAWQGQQVLLSWHAAWLRGS